MYYNSDKDRYPTCKKCITHIFFPNIKLVIFVQVLSVCLCICDLSWASWSSRRWCNRVLKSATSPIVSKCTISIHFYPFQHHFNPFHHHFSTISAPFQSMSIHFWCLPLIISCISVPFRSGSRPSWESVHEAALVKRPQ